MREDRAEYDPQRRSRAGTTLSVRVIAAGYLIYLGYTLIRDLLNGSTTMPVWLSWAAGIGFAAAGAAFGWYTWKRYQADLKAARLPEADKTDGNDDASDRAD